jgi:3-dehydroquinate synthase
MASIAIELPHHRYDVVIEAGGLERLGETVRAVAPHRECALFSDGAIADSLGVRARDALERAGYRVALGRLEPGEEHKTLETVRDLYDLLLGTRLERRAPVIALGGGVTGDTVGFAAATYLRGVPFVQCPTTLLAMVDSSVGGKVGVNVPQGKNLVGAFHQPVVVVIDPLVLGTLPVRELRCGLAECIKHAAIRDASLLDLIERDRAPLLSCVPDVLTELVRRNVAIKAAVVMADERESGVRAHLNFGHTFAHAIETTVGYGELLHGEAVALGMIAASALARRLGMCGGEVPVRLREVIAAVGLPTSAELPSDERLLAAMSLDKKVAGGRLRFVLPERLGSVVVRDDVAAGDVSAAWSEIRA